MELIDIELRGSGFPEDNLNSRGQYLIIVYCNTIPIGYVMAEGMCIQFYNTLDGKPHKFSVNYLGGIKRFLEKEYYGDVTFKLLKFADVSRFFDDEFVGETCAPFDAANTSCEDTNS